MTAWVVQSSMTGVAANNPATGPPAASLALAVFRNAKNEDDANFNAHAPSSRRRSNVMRLMSSPPTENSRKTSRYVPASGENKRGSSSIDTIAIHLYHRWLQLPQIFRFGVAGNLGNIGFFYLEKAIFRSLSHLVVTTSVRSSPLLDAIEKFQDTISFFSAYVIQIVTTHLLYAFLVYGMDTIGTYEKYRKTLVGQFKVYGVGLFGATFLNSFLIHSGGLGKTVSFWVTMGIFAFFNYFLVTWVVKNAVESSSTDSTRNEGNNLTKSSRRR